MNRTALALAISVAYRYAAEEGEEEQESKGGGGGASPTLLRFFEEHDDKRIENPATGNQVKYQTAFGYGKSTKPYQGVLEIYKKWLDKNDLKDDSVPAKKEKVEKTPAKKETPKSESKPTEKTEAKPKLLGEVTISGDETDKKDMKAWKDKLPGKASSMSHEEISSLMGFGGSGAKDSFKVRVEFDDMDPPPGIAYSTAGGPIKKMRRKLSKDKEGVFLYNDEIRLDPGAPKGTGTKILANQIDEARSAGIGRIVCTAFRDDSRGFVGHYVWARLGYDGNIHEPASDDEEGNPNSKEDIKKAVAAGDLPKSLLNATKASDFMKDPKAREWWKKNGWSFKATFDTSKESQSSKVFDAYMKARK